MLSMIRYVLDRLPFHYLKDERGVETLEWLAIGLLIVTLAAAVYPGTLGTALNGVIGSITAVLAGS